MLRNVVKNLYLAMLRNNKNMLKFSVIIPVYNRPDELRELLESLARQTQKPYEVLVIEDGSKNKADTVASQFTGRLNLHYFFKENTGQGFSRNYGFERASGDYFVVFDSDALVPAHYFAAVDQYLSRHWLDAYGGPDAAHPDFTPIQKAISYSMTSPFTTGGIRGRKNNAGGAFHPRSFNMGLSRRVFEETGGFAKRDMGEDIELSTRLIKMGYTVGLIEEAYVYHKRRGTLRAFFKQIISFGRTRIQLGALYGVPVKLVHTFPALFTLFVLVTPFLWLINVALFGLAAGLLLLFSLLILLDASAKEKSFEVGILSVLAAFVQLTGYGFGFLSESFNRLKKID